MGPSPKSVRALSLLPRAQGAAIRLADTKSTLTAYNSAFPNHQHGTEVIYIYNNDGARPAVRFLDGLAFPNVNIPLVQAGVRITIVNCFNLTASDFADNPIATCGDAGAGCLESHCAPSAVGVSCFCDALGARRDASDCALSFKSKKTIFLCDL